MDDRIPPTPDHLTEYDRRNAVVYLRLLDAEADEADWREVVAVVLGLDPDDSGARRVYEANLERAKWMTRVGFRQLVRGGWTQ